MSYVIPAAGHDTYCTEYIYGVCLVGPGSVQSPENPGLPGPLHMLSTKDLSALPDLFHCVRLQITQGAQTVYIGGYTY